MKKIDQEELERIQKQGKIVFYFILVVLLGIVTLHYIL